jgi:hypothetical protein
MMDEEIKLAFMKKKQKLSVKYMICMYMEISERVRLQGY